MFYLGGGGWCWCWGWQVVACGDGDIADWDEVVT